MKNKPSLSDFIKEDRFELNSYLNHLLNQLREQSEENMVKQLDVN